MSALFAEMAPAGDLWVLAGVVAIAGIVRGFSGFGTALILMPVAATMLTPVEALVMLVVMEMAGPLPNLPRAWRDGQPKELGVMVAGLCLGLPIGLWLLTRLPVDPFRWAVSLAALALLAALMAGLRWRGGLGRGMMAGTGLVGGVMGGAFGLVAPPVIMLYMGSTLPVQAIRANLALFIQASNMLSLGMLWTAGHLTLGAVGNGVAMLPVYLLANIAGAAIFRPERERAYRWSAYGIIAGSALIGLPLFD
ncbi:MAG: sulfite exporter TauE/SafE family protein [Qingshengfaniella sp.]